MFSCHQKTKFVKRKVQHKFSVSIKWLKYDQHNFPLKNSEHKCNKALGTTPDRRRLGERPIQTPIATKAAIADRFPCLTDNNGLTRRGVSQPRLACACLVCHFSTPTHLLHSCRADGHEDLFKGQGHGNNATQTVQQPGATRQGRGLAGRTPVRELIGGLPDVQWCLEGAKMQRSGSSDT